MRGSLSAIIAVLFISSGVSAGDFRVLFEGHGDIVSYIYFKQNGDYFIDTELSANIETFAYKRFFFMVDLFKETHMGRKYRSNMVFDPTRAHWSFGLAGRLEFQKYFMEAQIHHDCFHDIDRWHDNSVYWNSLRLGFGNMKYLSKIKYHQPEPKADGLIWENGFDYHLIASFFAPRGMSFQKHHDYEFTMNTDFQYRLLRYKRIGIDLDSDNLWVLDKESELKRRHRLDLNFTIYGDKGAMMIYFRHWPYDNQSIRSRADHKWAFGIHLGF